MSSQVDPNGYKMGKETDSRSSIAFGVSVKWKEDQHIVKMKFIAIIFVIFIVGAKSVEYESWSVKKVIYHSFLHRFFAFSDCLRRKTQRAATRYSKRMCLWIWVESM